MKKKMIGVLLTLVMAASATACEGGSSNLTDDYERLNSADLAATTSVIGIDDYRDKVKGAYAGQMIGVAYGYPVEFWYKTWIPESSLPRWTPDMINEGYNQDDIYLSVTGVEALDKYGLDVTSRTLGIDMFNRDFEYWNGSNNDVMARGYAPPYAGYPKYSADGNLTTWFPDGNSYQCGGSLGGVVGLNMTGFTNEICQRFGEICTYGDGIYGMQFISAMYGASFFSDDVREVIRAGRAAIPADSWSTLVIDATLANFDAGMSASDNFFDIYQKYVVDEEYQWIPWPSGGILLDAKMCSAFTLIGLLYGNKDLEQSIRLTVQCANDSDSTAAATAGILCAMTGYSGIDPAWLTKLDTNVMFKYSSQTLDGLVDTCERVATAAIKAGGGKKAYVDGTLSFVIPAEAKAFTVEKYKNSKYPEPMEVQTFTAAERAQMRVISDPGFERHSASITNGWGTTSAARTKTERMKGEAHTGICNIKITGSEGRQDLYTLAEVEKNTNYEITCYIKTGAGFGPKLELFAESGTGTGIRVMQFGGSTEWTQIKMTFNSGSAELVKFGIAFENGSKNDVLRVDDFTFFKV